MNKKKVLLLFVAILTMIVSNVYILKHLKFLKNDKEIKLSYILKSDKKDIFQIFYSEDKNWKEEKSQKIEYKRIYKAQNFEYFIPIEMKIVRLDFGNNVKKLEIKKIELEYDGKKQRVEISPKTIMYQNGITEISTKEDVYNIKTEGNDPFIIMSLESFDIDKLIVDDGTTSFSIIFLKIALCVVIDVIILLLVKKAKNIFFLIKELRSNWTLILNLSKNDFKTKYAGSYLGMIWAFVNPIVTILVYWFVFEFGLRAGSPIAEVPFILWLMAGLIPWFFYSEGLNSATNSMYEYSYLVKKVVFKISVLPVVKIISSLFIHLVFIGFLFIVAFAYKFYPTIHTIQIFYYLFCLFFIILATSYATSAIVLFFKDLGQLINIFLQIGVWMTPIMWNYSIITKKYQWIVKLNPMMYIVEGYRDTFIYKIWFWEKQVQTLYFWIFCLIIFIISMLVYRKLKPHFADVL